MNTSTTELIKCIKHRRNRLGLTQKELAGRLRFVRDLEQGKETLRLDKVNEILALFGYKLDPIKTEDRDELLKSKGYQMWRKRMVCC